MNHWKTALDQFLIDWGNKEYISGVLVAGSTIAGTSNTYSDLDVHIVLHRGVSWRERGDRVISGIHIEYFANPVEKIEAYMREDELSKKITARMFAMGKIISDIKGDIPYLCEVAKEVLATHLPPMPLYAQSFIKHVLWSQLEDIRILFNKNDPMLPLVYYRALNKLFLTYSEFLRVELPAPTKLYRYFTESSWRQVYRMHEFPDSHFVDMFLVANGGVDIHWLEKITSYILEKMGGFEIDGFCERGDLS